VTCPLCGGVLEVVAHPDGFVMEEVWPPFCTATTRPTLRPKLVPFLACSSCEFCQEGTVLR
jgi:hypothetical protein